jgi:hypothetical protein
VLVVGNGSSESDRSNAVSITKDNTIIHNILDLSANNTIKTSDNSLIKLPTPLWGNTDTLAIEGELKIDGICYKLRMTDTKDD